MNGTLPIILLSITTLGMIVMAWMQSRTTIRVAQIQAETKEVKETAAKVENKVAELGIKVDGRLTQLLEISIENSQRKGAQEEQEKSKEVLALQNEMNISSAKLIGKLEGQKEEKEKQDQQTSSNLPSVQGDQPVKVEVVNAPLEVKSTDIKGISKNKT